MKILLATSTITPRAGISAYNRELCRVLSETNIMHLMCYEKIKEYADCEKTISLPCFSLKYIRDVERLLRVINDECYDLIINSNSKIMALISPYINRGTKIITVSHSLRYTESDIAAFNASYVDGIVALSSYNKEYLEKKFAIKNNNKVRVIYNFVLPYESADIIRTTKKNNQKINIVFAGGTASSKSPELVIRVLNRLLKTDLDFKFFFLGVKTPPLKSIQPFKSIESIIPSDQRVEMPGKVPTEEARKIFAECNVFLAPSRREGCPMALLEALRVGTIPIVADYNIANRELIENEISGYVINHKNIDEFVKRIIDIIMHHESYSSIYDNSYKLYQEKLTYEVWYAKMTKLIYDNDNWEYNHFRRQKFSRIHYCIDSFKFSLMNFFNKIHLFFNESLPAALPILLMYLFKPKTNK